MTKDMKNTLVIDNFLSNNRHIENNGVIAQFQATVEYSPANISDTTTVVVNTDTFNYGNIEIHETKRINLKIIHTGFTTRFNDYVHDKENNTLIIHGTAHSTKGGKPYTVTIIPC